MKKTKSLLSVVALSFFVLSAYAAGGDSNGADKANPSGSASTSMGITTDTNTNKDTAKDTDANGNAINHSYGTSADQKDQKDKGAVKHRPNTNDTNAPDTSASPESRP